MTVTIRDGDWVVTRSRWNIEARKAVRVTAQLLFYIDTTWGNRERRIRIADVIFAGPEQIAKKLVERLITSGAIHDDEHRRSVERRVERDNAHLQAALAEKEGEP